MIDDVEALLALRPVHRGDVDEAGELAGRGVAQERRHLDDVGGGGVHGQLAAHDLIAGDRSAEAVLNGLPDPFELLYVHILSVQRSIVPVRRIFFCSSITP